MYMCVYVYVMCVYIFAYKGEYKFIITENNELNFNMIKSL